MAPMKYHCLASILFLALLVGPSVSCRKDDSGASTGGPPIQELDWRYKGEGLREWGQTHNGFFGISVKRFVLERWKWDGPTLKKDLSVEQPPVIDVAVLPGKKYLARTSPGNDHDTWPLVLVSIGSNRVIKKWVPRAGWLYGGIGSSRNGKFAAVTLSEHPGAPPKDYNWKRGRFRVGLLKMSMPEIRWVAELIAEGGMATVGKIAVSEDGRYIAVAGWNNGMAMVDASVGKVLWTGRPADAVSLRHVVFSSDGLTVYAGGSGLYAFDTRTGKVTGE